MNSETENNNPYDPTSMPGGEVKNLNAKLDNDKVSGTIQHPEDWQPDENLESHYDNSGSETADGRELSDDK